MRLYHNLTAPENIGRILALLGAAALMTFAVTFATVDAAANNPDPCGADPSLCAEPAPEPQYGPTPVPSEVAEVVSDYTIGIAAGTGAAAVTGGNVGAAIAVGAGANVALDQAGVDDALEAPIQQALDGHAQTSTTAMHGNLNLVSSIPGAASDAWNAAENAASDVADAASNAADTVSDAAEQVANVACTVLGPFCD